MKKKQRLSQEEKAVLIQIGEQIRLARLRRRLSMDRLAKEAKVSRTTLWAIEKGKGGTSMASFIKVIAALKFTDDFLKIGEEDKFGRTLQDEVLKAKWRAPRTRKK